MKDLRTEIKIKFLDFVRLKPYKNFLLTADAKNWLVGMAFLAFLLAASEGTIWGYLIKNYFFNETVSSTRIWLPLLIGIAIAIVIWLIDAQIVNMDLSYYEKKKESKIGRIAKIQSFLLKYLFNKPTFVLFSRISILLISIYFTAPALTKLVLNDEVEAKISKERFDLKTQLYDKVEVSYSSIINGIKEDIEIINSDLDKEIGGTRILTGSRVGYGPNAKKLDERIKEKHDDIDKYITRRNHEYELIEKNDFETLKNKYNHYIEGATTASLREKAFNEVLKDKNNKFLSDIAKTIIILVFAAFLLFKVFQPITVSNYFNNKMQDAHLEYRRGELDNMVVSASLPVFNENGGMSIHKFFEFYTRLYLPTIYDSFDKVRIKSYEQKAQRISFINNQLVAKEAEITNLKTLEEDILQSTGNLNSELDETIINISELIEQEKILLELTKSKFNNVSANQNLIDTKEKIQSQKKNEKSLNKKITNSDNKLVEINIKKDRIKLNIDNLLTKKQSIEIEMVDDI